MKTKTIFTLMVASLSCLFVNATVRTVNNNNPSPGQYSTFSAAYTAASNSDTIYVSGSNSAYTGVQLLKQLTIIGTGHNPDKQNPLVSTFPWIDCGGGSAGTKFIGINFTSNPTIAASSIMFESCKISTPTFSAAGVSGVFFNKCVITGNVIVNQTVFNIFFNNSVLAGQITPSSSFTIGGAATNCLFLGNALTSVANNLNAFTFTHCIFYGTSPQITGTNTSTSFVRSLSYACPNNTFGGTTNTSVVTNLNPLFTTYAPPGFHYTDNYALQNASPVHLFGSDGKDIGLYGGTDGVNFHMGGEPWIPQIRQMDINVSSIPSGQSINVNIISTRKQ